MCSSFRPSQGEVSHKCSKGPRRDVFRRSASTESLQPDDSRFGGPLRLLRRHLPLKGEDCENDDVLIIQGLAGGGPAQVLKGPEN